MHVSWKKKLSGATSDLYLSLLFIMNSKFRIFHHIPSLASWGSLSEATAPSNSSLTLTLIICTLGLTGMPYVMPALYYLWNIYNNSPVHLCIYYYYFSHQFASSPVTLGGCEHIFCKYVFFFLISLKVNVTCKQVCLKFNTSVTVTIPGNIWV